MANFFDNQHLYTDQNINNWSYVNDAPGVDYYTRRRAYAHWVRLTAQIPDQEVQPLEQTPAMLAKLQKIHHVRQFIVIQHRNNPDVVRPAWWLAPDYREQGTGRMRRRSTRYTRGRTWRSMPRYRR